MSRVRVLNLPKEITDATLRQHIAKGLPRDAPPITITDTFIKRGADGKVRMAFVGFKTSAAGEFVVKHFNGTYMGSLKLAVEPALAVGTRPERLTRSVSTAANAPAAGTKAPRRDAGESAKLAAAEEPDAKAKRREEFVAQRLQHEHSTSWAAEILAPEETAARRDEEEDTAPPVDLGAVSDMDFLAGLASKTAVLNDESAADGPTDSTNGTGRPEADVDVAAVEDDAQEDGTDPAAVALVRSTCRIRVRNIPFTATEAEVKNYFSSLFGPVSEVVVPLTRDTKQSKGIAFVTFAAADDAERALRGGNMRVFMGRLVRVEASDPPRASGRAVAEATAAEAGGNVTAQAVATGASSAFKATRAEELRSTDSALRWNSLYMQSHAAVTTMAKRLDVDRSAIVSVEHSGAAVRAAVAEAILTSEARHILGDEGINLDAINGSSARLTEQRSNTTILVKNLPPGADLADLVKQFKRFGPLETVACPGGSAFALFAFVHTQDARTAFQRLAYKKFSGTVLFLEWAPLGSIIDPEQRSDNAPDATTASSAGARGGADDDDEGEADKQLAARTAAHTLYITNLPFTATEEALRVFLLDCAPRLASSSAQAIRRVNLLADKGRAFVDFNDAQSFEYARARINGRKMDGRAVAAVAAASSTKPPTGPAVERPHGSNAHAHAPPGCDPLKIIVKNLPFEATEADLRELFKAFSEVKAVRVPRKVHAFSSHRENNHRGFGFVEFLTEEEAARALRTLANTHLYGRHLVLQYAKAGGDGS